MKLEYGNQILHLIGYSHKVSIGKAEADLICAAPDDGLSNGSLWLRDGLNKDEALL
jgi:hypothetical protein